MKIKWLIILILAGAMIIPGCAKKAEQEVPAAEPAMEESAEPAAEAAEAAEEAPAAEPEEAAETQE